MTDQNQLTVTQPAAAPATVFTNAGAFDLAQRQAKALADSDLVPAQYKGRVSNCLVALEVSQRCGSSALAVMQSLHIIHGRPSWSAQFVIGAVNSCGRFEPLEFRMTGEGDQRTCVAWTRSRKTGETIEGPPVSIAMAKSEGWFQKNGSKWPSMPELMLRYRAATFFGRLYAPEILLGMKTDDEEREIVDVKSEVADAGSAAANLNKKIRAKKSEASVAPAREPEVVGEENGGHF
ncbi:MAG: hypothetical protein ACXWPM_04400 [Bdellovibrionota bacterium]